MRLVDPYATFMELEHAFDNGGRLWHIFVQAGDGVVEKSEIELASSGDVERITPYCFLAMVAWDLDKADHSRVLCMLSPEVRRYADELWPVTLRPGEVEDRGGDGDIVIMEGRLDYVTDDSVNGAFWRTVPGIFSRHEAGFRYAKLALADAFTLCRLVSHTEPRCGSALVGLELDTELGLQGHIVRLAGMLHEVDHDDENERDSRLILRPLFYTVLDRLKSA